MIVDTKGKNPKEFGGQEIFCRAYGKLFKVLAIADTAAEANAYMEANPNTALLTEIKDERVHTRGVAVIVAKDDMGV